MGLTAVEYKNQGNEFYATKKTSEAIQSYTEAIKLIQTNPDENLPLFVLYSNRAAAYIQDKDFYSGYQDAKRSLKLEKRQNFKAFYRAALCAYHLGFLSTSQSLIDEVIKDYQGKSDDYTNVKQMIEKKMKCMTEYRKPQVTAKRVLKTLEKIIKNGVLLHVISAGLYQLRYLLRSYFEKKKDRKLMNVDTGDLGLRLHELAVTFNATIDIEKLFETDPIFEDLILNEMPDVGPLRLRAFEQRSLPRDERDYDLEEAAADDLTAYEFSFFTNNVLAYLVVEGKDPNVSQRALKQLHRLTTIDLYRKSLGDALSDAMNTYIYAQSKNIALIDKLVSNNGVSIFFHDYIEAACHLSAARMIGKITVEQWKRQTSPTIQFVLKQIRKKIDNEGIDLVEPKFPSEFRLQLERLMNFNDHHPIDRHEDLHLMVKVLSKIYLAFGKQPFVSRSMDDPFYSFVVQTSLKQLEKEEDEKKKIAFLRQTWTMIITNWLKLDYATRRSYSEPMDHDDFDDDDD